MVKASIKVLWIMLIILASSYPSFTQDKPIVPPECSPGEVRNPLVSLYFERADKVYNDVVFRLINNSSCDVLIETQGHQFLAGKLGDALVLQDGASVSVFYTTEHPRTGVKQTPLKLGQGCILESTESLLRAGHSILFRVPLDKIKRRFNIIVDFRFSAEKWPMKYEAYFNSEILAASLRR